VNHIESFKASLKEYLYIPRTFTTTKSSKIKCHLEDFDAIVNPHKIFFLFKESTFILFSYVVAENNLEVKEVDLLNVI